MFLIDSRLGLAPTADQPEDQLDAEVEENQLTRFEKADEYMATLDKLLAGTNASSSSDAESYNLTSGQQATPLSLLASILDEYQEQSYLLDPYLERLVTPPIAALQSHARGSHRLPAGKVVELSRLVYLYTKIRGYKVITTFFPHEVGDLTPTLTFVELLQAGGQGSAQHGDGDLQELAHCWEVRYVLLLWLSLVCMIPFDLEQFDLERQNGNKRSTASRLEQVGRAYLESPGKERDAAAAMLGKLFQRRDVRDAQFEAFVAYCSATLVSKPSSFAATGILQSLCEIVKTNDPAFVTSRLPLIQAVLELYDDPDRADFANNGLVAKYQAKLTCRLGLKLLRPRKRRRFIRIRALGQGEVNDVGPSGSNELGEDDDEEDVPELIDAYISKLIEALQHKDTVVRYSAAKGLARLCERLPRHFITQVTDAIVSLFHINVPDLYEGANDLNAVSECTWQGTCIALAEQARRGQLFAKDLGEKLVWIEKALLFDVRRGAHSVGANVRDSACYVVWALARAHDAEAIRPHALSLAQKLVAVATLDRDVSIRRAASAAFQECVGRLDLFPHGIDVIRITDFYAVSVRKNAFLRCAVEAAQYSEYRGYLLKHLLDVTIAHWDPAMRRLGAKAIAGILEVDPAALTKGVVEELRQCGASVDNTLLHGALLSLAEIGSICASSSKWDEDGRVILCETLFASIRELAEGRLKRQAPSQVLEAACRLVASAFNLAKLLAEPRSREMIHGYWESVITAALLDTDEVTRHISLLGDCTALQGWKTLTVAEQQSSTLLLGSIDYTKHVDRFEIALDHLMALVDVDNIKSPASRYSQNVETRRNAYVAIVRAVEGLSSNLDVLRPAFFHSLLSSLLTGLQDYTTDQRGDVGSWIRLACLWGLSSLLAFVRRQCRPSSSTSGCIEELVPSQLYHRVVGGMMKQTVERIDHVRDVAGRCLVQLLKEEEAEEDKRMRGSDLVRRSFIKEDGSTIDFKNASALYPLAVRLLLLPEYREDVLLGLLTAVGSKSDLGHRTIFSALLDFLADDEEQPTPYTSLDIVRDLTSQIERNFSKNNIVLPALELLRGIVEGGMLDDVLSSEDEEEVKKWETILTKLHKVSTHALSKLKSHGRIQSSILVNLALLPISLSSTTERRCVLTSSILGKVASFLAVPFPTVRAAAAEYLFTLLEVHELLPSPDDNEEGTEEPDEEQQAVRVLSETRWATASLSTIKTAAETVQSELLRLLVPDRPTSS